jgi:excisionase family DNA binding protein
MVSELDGSGFETLLDELAERIAAELVIRLAAEREPGDPGPSSAWMAIEKAAAYLDWPKQRLYKLSASGAIPHYKQEGRLLFHRDELDDWLRRFAEGSR